MVGENSTGKTSILKLLDLFQHSNFWGKDSFDTSSYKLGGFKDIISVVDSTKKEFAVGMMRTSINRNTKKRTVTSFLAVYKNQEGLPYCTFLGVAVNSNVLNFKLHGNIIKYNISKLPLRDIRKGPKFIFPAIMKKESIKIDSYNEIPVGPEVEHLGITVLTMPLIIMSIESEKKKLLADIKKKIKDFVTVSPLNIALNLVLFAPIRTTPKRTYDGYDKSFNAEGEHTPYVIRKTLSSRKKAKEFIAALENFGRKSGLFRKVITKVLGKETAAPFELQVVIEGYPLRIDNVGYGMSQILPLVVEIIKRRKGSWFALQQPEIHLHPKAQAALGDLLFYMAKAEDKKFIIETHSDFTLDRFRINMHKKKHDLTAQVLFFERKNDRNRVTAIPIGDNGAYSKKQPHSFRDFFLKEQFELLKV
jgi:hypothetical protein